MGVLDAWKDAEKITYPVVGEETKDAENVIDYDIHDEITIDSSSVLNANNDTTTGMATIIPGMNAPKLIATTSIIGGIGADVLPNVSIYVPINYFNSGQNEQLSTGIIVYSQGDAGFRESSGTVIVGDSGTYLIRADVSRVYDNDTRTKTVTLNNNGATILSSTSLLNGTDSKYIISTLNKGDILTFYCQVNTTAGASLDGNLVLSLLKQ